MYEISEWRHVFKLDPAKELSDEALERLCESGTDAIMVGGTDDVTLDNVLQLMARIRRYVVPCVLEVSNLEALTPGFDYYFIPSVLNSKDREWIVGLHHDAIKEFGDIMNWDEIIFEGYCILNDECKAAQVTKADTALSSEDVIAYARMAEKMLRLPIFYMEYSGTYGDVNVVKEAKASLTQTQLFYGGGIRDDKQAVEMAKHADTIVVGNIIYDDVEAALQTVRAIKKDK
ncbi:heptaprenylglyceryl phosphate synthase [Bacillus sp. HMF5848]|uniref:heptaprenylglyceryl phosphate synthase n=1 Tax=Bacillus sp. HMF5848 TaxID=2495421 RepID=UPI000F7A58B1|nr:heptaprenylglyceryl phosphate synthase [Bacillus sp. HMF5848]RSK25769.1 heptaprenylglyceryl phosphate synthase [Bacillus sp. HMF5848]